MTTRETTVSCPACGGTRVQAIEEWRLKGDYRAMACWTCGLLFADPQPAREVLDAYYAPSGGWTASRSDPLATRAQTRTKGRAGQAVIAMLDACVPGVPERRVLDFGCGTGAWLNSFQDAGWDTFGIEPATDAAFVRHRRLTALPPEGDFHVVMAYHVLEHLSRPLEMLQSLAGAMRADGYLFISVPRLDTVGIHRDVGYCLAPPTHLVAFTEACLRGLLARCGVETTSALHDLDGEFTNGRPVRMRLLARKSSAPVTSPDPSPALRAVIDMVRHVFTRA